MPTQEIFNQQLIDSPVNGALGGLPVAEKNQEYFIVFKQAGGTGPEIIGETAYFISYLVKADGTVNKPSEDYDSLDNLIQNFEVGKNAVVRQDTATALNSQLAGKHKITAIGRQQPILYSQTGSLNNSFTSSIFFNEGQQAYVDINTEDFRGTMLKITSFTTSDSYQLINYYTSILSPPPPASAASFNQVNGSYSIETAGIGNLESIFFRIRPVIQNTYPTYVTTTFEFRKYDDIAGDYTTLIEKSYNIPPNSTFTPDFNDSLMYLYQYSDINGFAGGPFFQVRVKNNLGGSAGDVFITAIQFITETQNPSPGTTAVPADQLPFWTTGSAGDLWITASSYLSVNYNRIQNLNGFSLDDGFNFSPIVKPFNLNIGDRIRFEYNKSNDRYIYDIIEPSEALDGLLKIKVNKSIPSTVNMNNFLLHQTDATDPAYIILDVDKDETVEDTQNFNGVILPEYPTQELKDNLDTIILDLKEKGIITDNEN